MKCTVRETPKHQTVVGNIEAGHVFRFLDQQIPFLRVRVVNSSCVSLQPGVLVVNLQTGDLYLSPVTSPVVILKTVLMPEFRDEQWKES